MLRVVYSFRGDENENSLSLDPVKELILVLLFEESMLEYTYRFSYR